MMSKSDIDWALHQIVQMVILARRSAHDTRPSTDPAYLMMSAAEHEFLIFIPGGILDKVVALKEDWATEQPAAASPDAGSDGRRSGASDEPEPNWRSAYMGIEDSLCSAVLMSQITTELVMEDDGRKEKDYRNQILFAARHSQQLLEDLRASYFKTWKQLTGDADAAVGGA